MGRGAKLLKPRSWDAADIRLFSISPSFSHQAQFSIPNSWSLTISTHFCIPHLRFLCIQHYCFIPPFTHNAFSVSLPPFHCCFSELFFSSVLNQCSASGPIWLCRENLYNRFSWEFMQLPPFIASTLWRLLSKFVGFEKKSWSLVKMGEIKGYFGSSREEDARNALPGSEIDGRGSLSWLSSLSRFRPREAVASIVISAWLLLHLLYWILTTWDNISQTDHSKLWTK